MGGIVFLLDSTILYHRCLVIYSYIITTFGVLQFFLSLWIFFSDLFLLPKYTLKSSLMQACWWPILIIFCLSYSVFISSSALKNVSEVLNFRIVVVFQYLEDNVPVVFYFHSWVWEVSCQSNFCCFERNSIF